MDDAASKRLLSLTFAVTIFVSASLLFVVQPMVGKMILPHLGGSSAVWTTCMLFFQSMLVLGYGYAHLVAQRLSPRRQVMVHVALAVVALAGFLPFEVADGLLKTHEHPALWLLAALFVSTGLPLFIVASSAPLFQHWFVFTGHDDADDPYYLYAASNAGSMLALFGYPFVVERWLPLGEQSVAWAWGFGLLAVLATGCGAFVVRRQAAAGAPRAPARRREAVAEPVGWRRRGFWLLVTFIPSSLMLGVTQVLTTDIASVPLLWVLPLGLYLLSFIVVFARGPVSALVGRWSGRIALPTATLLVLAATYAKFWPMSVIAGLHLGLFLFYALYFHGRLAADRPQPVHLTEYYIWMAVGGALGGLFNALIAPAVFDWNAEYYLVLAGAMALIGPFVAGGDDEEAGRDRGRWQRAASWGGALLAAVAVVVYLRSVEMLAVYSLSMLLGLVIVGGTVVWVAAQFPESRNIGLAVVLLVGAVVDQATVQAVAVERSFFSNYRVYTNQVDGHEIRVISMGTTQHGLQDRDPGHEFTPIGYYHPAGPIGDIFGVLDHERVGVAGLGSGALAPYATLGAEFVFYEIDPVVEQIARDHFSFLDHCGRRCSVEIGDARKLLEQAEPHGFDLLFMDAYNSDSVPTHLLTREALELYMSRVDDDGVVVFHVSNRFLDVESIVGALARDAGLVARTRPFSPTKRGDEALAYTAVYTVVAREEAHLDKIARSPLWRKTEVADVVWTDDFTNIASVFYWW